MANGLPDWVEGDALRLKQVLVNLLRFKVQLPLPSTAAAPGERAATASAQRPLVGMRVLAADDVKVNRLVQKGQWSALALTT